MSGLKKSDVKGLQLIAEMLHAKNPLDADQCTQIATFVKSCVSNRALNELLINFQDEAKQKLGLDDAAVLFVIIVSFRTRFLNKLPAGFFDKLAVCQKKLTERAMLMPDEKLKLEEFAIAIELAAINDSLRILERSGVTKLDPELQILHERAKRCGNLHDLIAKMPEKKVIKDGMKLFESLLHKTLQRYIVNLSEVVNLNGDAPQNIPNLLK